MARSRRSWLQKSYDESLPRTATKKFARPAHFRRASIAEMRVMSPDHDFSRGTEILDQRIESFKHVLVAEIPGGHATPKHGSVVALGVLHNARILFGYEKFAGLHMAFAARRVSRSTLHFHQLT